MHKTTLRFHQDQFKKLTDQERRKLSIRCRYCEGRASLVPATEIFAKTLQPDQWLYYCRRCVAWVGCHMATSLSLGEVADKDLRDLRRAAHQSFDAFWNTGRYEKRKGKREKAYDWLAREMGISRDDCHIGMFDKDQCREVIRVCMVRREREQLQGGQPVG